MKIPKFKFHTNKECEYFPCHSDVDIDKFNCLFCYCPLMAQVDCLGIKSGKAKYLENGWKDCSNCTIFHNPNNYELMMSELNKFLIEED